MIIGIEKTEREFGRIQDGEQERGLSETEKRGNLVEKDQISATWGADTRSGEKQIFNMGWMRGRHRIFVDDKGCRSNEIS